MISVIVPVRNGMPWLDHQLRALAGQRCDEPWEVVVADNGSTDGSRTLVRDWADRCHAIRSVDASALRGAPAARNAGVRATKSELLAFCDADDVVQPGWIAACVEALVEADVTGGFFDFWSLNGYAPSGAVPAATRQLGFLPAGLTANLAVRRDAFDAVGGFAEELRAGEDIDLCWRLQLRGYRFMTAPKAVVAKRERADFAQMFVRAALYGRSGPILYRRHRSSGAQRNLRGAAKSWMWLAMSVPRLVHPERRIEWARTAGMRLGRLLGSLRQGVFFP